MPRKLPSPITQEDFEKLFKAESDKKIKLSMLLGFEAGMRISEIVGYGDKIKPLSKSQIGPASIKVIGGKGQKDRVVPRPKRMNETALKLLPLKLNRRTLQRKVTILGEKVLGKHITFHTLRHGFGSHLVNQGRPLHEVQMLMGHSRLDTTGIYLHASPDKAVGGARDAF